MQGYSKDPGKIEFWQQALSFAVEVQETEIVAQGKLIKDQSEEIKILTHEVEFWKESFLKWRRKSKELSDEIGRLEREAEGFDLIVGDLEKEITRIEEVVELWKKRAHEEAWNHHDDEGLYSLPEWFEN